ncbi:MAG TPA: tripartite tricarboxylate transporter substrate binding protein [Eoetvoesiella sp.]
MQNLNRRTLLQCAIALIGVAGAAYSGVLRAEDNYPSRPITIVVPHPPGGSVDGVARLFADKLKDQLNETVIIENRAGASGMIGAAHVARAQPDGYTLYINASIHSINPLLYSKTIKFDAVKDFTAVSMLAQGALIFSVNPQVPAKTVSEFIKLLKASPTKYNFATTGFGSASHLSIAQFRHENGLTDIPIVLYKGASPALQDLVGGQVSAIMDPMLSSLPLVQGGKLRALAVTGAQRSPQLPEVPTMLESGIKDFEFYSWYGLWAPANLPEPVRAKLDAATAKIVADPAFKSRMEQYGFESIYKNSADFSKFIDAEMVRYAATIKEAEISVN